jgi:Type II secretory pathway, component PulK
VLVIVLVTILFVSTALVLFVERAGDDLIVEAREATARRLRLEAYSALDVTLAVLEDFRVVNDGLRSPAEGWGDPLGFAGWTPGEGRVAEVSFEDESGKLSLPQADMATLTRLFESWELSQSDAERLADALMGWMREDHVMASARVIDYENGPLPYVPPHRSLRSYQELAAVEYAREFFYDEQGQPNDWWRRFVGATSLYDFKQTNVNGGRDDVLAAFGVSDPGQIRRVSDYLRGTGDRAYSGPGYFETPDQLAALVGAGALPEGAGTLISALRINVVIREGRSEFRVSTVIAPEGGAKAVGPTKVGGESENEETERSTTARTDRKASEEPATDTGKKLRYPFTLLEIRENAEISAVPPGPTTA